MPKKNTKSANEIPVIDECEVEGFVNVGLPISPHVNFNLSRNKEHDSIREKKPLDMFYTRWELGEIITKCDREYKAEKKAKEAKDAKYLFRKDLTTIEQIEVDQQTPPGSSYKVTKENYRLMGSASKEEKRRRRHQPTLAHTFFGAQFGITQRTQMDAYRLWIDSDSSDEELDVEKDEGKRCCGLCVVQ